MFGADAKAGATVETTLGKVRGISIGKVNAFKGLRYGADTAGARRFLAPVKPAAWSGVLDTFEWGPEAPQVSPHGEIAEVPRDDSTDADERGLSAAQRVDAEHQRKASGDGVVPRRRIHERQRVLHDLRRDESGSASGRGDGDDQSSPQYVRVYVSRWASFECRHAGLHRGVGVGARQYLTVWRRSGECDDLRAIGRRREGVYTARDAGGEGAVP